MKKFTKGCLMTALILFLVGVVICGVSGLLGGFRQIREMNGIGGIPFGYQKSDDGNWHLGFFHNNGEIGRDWEKEQYLRISEGQENGISMNADAFTELDIELEDCFLYLEESQDDQIRVYVEGDDLRYYWLADGSTLCLRNAGKTKSNNNDEIHVSIPVDYTFREMEIDFGAGLLVATTPLSAREMDIAVGAGECEIMEVSADKADIVVGAGKLFVGALGIQTAEVTVGAGELVIDDIVSSDKLALSIGMGTALVNGTILGDLSLDCGMGSAIMELAGSEDDHSYEVEVAMGEVNVGHHNHGGFAASRSWNSGKDSRFDIECDMGSVTISFEDEH